MSITSLYSVRNALLALAIIVCGAAFAACTGGGSPTAADGGGPDDVGTAPSDPGASPGNAGPGNSVEDAVEASIVPPARPSNPNAGPDTNLDEQQDSGQTDPGDPHRDPLVQALLGEGFDLLADSSDGDRPTLRRPAGTAIPILSDGSPSASTDDTRYQTDLHSGSSTRTQTTCSGTTCTIAYGTDTATQTLVEGTSLETLLSVRLIYYTYRDVDFDLTLRTQSDPSNPRLERVFVGNLDYSTFGYSGAQILGGTNHNTKYVYGFSEGGATGSNPSGTSFESGSWIGWMTGADVGSTTSRHDVILGRAKITVKDLSATPKADVSFTSVRNASEGTDLDDIEWTDLGLTNGAFTTGSDGDYISGTFYGPAHVEVGGVFEKSSLAGAFGASWNTLTAGSLTWAVSAATARTRTGMSASALTNDAALTTLDGTIVDATDGFLHSDIPVFTGSDYESSGRVETTCSASTCTLGSSSYSFDDFKDGRPQASDHDSEIQRVGKKNNVEMAQVRAYDTHHAAIAFLGYGGWLTHSAFGSIARRYREGRLGYSEAWSAATYSFGDASGSNPTVAGTYSGLATGIDISGGTTHGNVIQGDASIVFDLTNTQVDVSFTNLKDIDTNTSLSNMTWDDLGVTSGAFSDGSNGDSIDGQFYGATHQEVGGIFEKDHVLGAFGAPK